MNLCAQERKKERRISFVDPFAVAVMKNGTIIGHVPRKISSVCSLFLDRNGSITCCVTGHKRYLHDLTQGGIEIPCTLTDHWIVASTVYAPVGVMKVYDSAYDNVDRSYF